MANYQLGPVIGKIGGAEVQKIPVNIETNTGGVSDSEIIMHTVHVPEGETWLVVLGGDLRPSYTSTLGPELFIGGVSIGPRLPRGHTSITAEVTGTAKIGMRRNYATGIEKFSGHVYTVPLPV